eukprot:g15145.t1
MQLELGGEEEGKKEENIAQALKSEDFGNGLAYNVLLYAASRGHERSFSSAVIAIKERAAEKAHPLLSSEPSEKGHPGDSANLVRGLFIPDSQPDDVESMEAPLTRSMLSRNQDLFYTVYDTFNRLSETCRKPTWTRRQAFQSATTGTDTTAQRGEYVIMSQRIQRLFQTAVELGDFDLLRFNPFVLEMIPGLLERFGDFEDKVVDTVLLAVKSARPTTPDEGADTRTPPAWLPSWESPELIDPLQRALNRGSQALDFFSTPIVYLFQDAWNILNVSTIILVGAVFILRIAILHGNGGSSFAIGTTTAGFSAQVLLAVSAIPLFARILLLSQIDDTLGPMSQIVWKMLFHLANSTVFVSVLVASFGLAFHSIFYACEETNLLNEEFGTFSDAFLTMIRAMLGDFNFESFKSARTCDISPWAEPAGVFFLVLYLAISAILLVNLVIAVLSTVHAETRYFWWNAGYVRPLMMVIVNVFGWVMALVFAAAVSVACSLGSVVLWFCGLWGIGQWWSDANVRRGDETQSRSQAYVETMVSNKRHGAGDVGEGEFRVDLLLKETTGLGVEDLQLRIKLRETGFMRANLHQDPPIEG